MQTDTVAAIKQALTKQPSPEQIARWRQDPRKGVQAALAAYDRRQVKQAQLRTAFEQRLELERAVWQAGGQAAGVDEVGRGPLAGPVVACAVVIDESFDLLAVHDSKQISAQHRLALDTAIKQAVVAYAFGVVSAQVIDQVNIYEASRQAMQLAIEHLPLRPTMLLIDAMSVDLPLPQQKLIKGDDRSISIGAASILAKNYRDALMADYDLLYPGYGFAHNAGYGTAEHLAALTKQGPSPIHRLTFAPVKKLI